MRNTIISICLLFFLMLSTVSAKTILVKSPGNHKDIQQALQAAVDKAMNGDLIILPTGQFIVNKEILINKFVSIKGQGLKKTILYKAESLPDSILSMKGWQSILFFDINSDKPGNIVIAGIGFKGKRPGAVKGDGGSTAYTYGIKIIRCVDFVIEQCRFEYFGYAGIQVFHSDTLARGVIKNNEFYYNAMAGLGYGVAVNGMDSIWVKNPALGTANFIFIEDNTFDFHRHSVASSSCGLYVFRYNTVLNNIVNPGGHAIDTHEARPGGGYNHGSRATEVYNNDIINTTYLDGSPIKNGLRIDELENTGIAIRSGDAVVFNNNIKGYRFATKISNWYFEDTDQTYPVLYSPGYISGAALGPAHTGTSSPQSDGDAFFWNNTNSPFGNEERFSVFLNTEPGWWKEGRDFHLEPKPGYKQYPYPYLSKKVTEKDNPINKKEK